MKEDATQAGMLFLMSMDFPRMDESQSWGFAVATKKPDWGQNPGRIFSMLFAHRRADPALDLPG